MDTDNVIRLLILLLFIVLSGVFSSMETALITMNQMRLRTLMDEGNRRAIILSKVLDRRSKMLSAILIANNVVNLSASSLATTLAMDLWGNAFVSVATGILTIVVLIFGEISPKNLAEIPFVPVLTKAETVDAAQYLSACTNASSTFAF